MGQAIGQVLLLAVGVALSPIPIIAVVLILVTPRARINAPLFVLGEIIGLTAVGVIVLGIAGPADATDASGPATWASVLKLVLGVLLLRVAWKQFRNRPRTGDDVAMPKWMGTIDSFTAARSLGAGVVLSALNPKVFLLAAAAAATIASTSASGTEQAVAYAAFVLIGIVGVAIPVVTFFALGNRSREILDQLKIWMQHNNAVIMAVICLLIGVKLIGDAISELST